MASFRLKAVGFRKTAILFLLAVVLPSVSLSICVKRQATAKLFLEVRPRGSAASTSPLIAGKAAESAPIAAVPPSKQVEVHPDADFPAVVAANPPGTTFIVYPGLYRLHAHIVPKDGDRFIGQTACEPPKSSCPAILSGSIVIGPLAKLSGSNYQVTGQTQHGIVSQPDKVCAPEYLGCDLPEDLFFDDVPYQHLAASSLPSIGPRQWWFDYSNHVIYFHDNPSGHTVETSVLDTAFDSAANNVTIQYLTVKDFANPLQRAGIEATSKNVNPSSSLNWVIRNCEAYNNHGAGVRFAFGTQVYDSYLHNNGNIGILGGTRSTDPSGIIIQGNTITHNNYAHVRPDWGAGGVKFGWTAGAIVRGNTIANNEGGGIHFDSDSMNPLIDGNTVKENAGGGGISYEISVGTAIVRNNIVLRNNVPGTVPISTADIGSYASVGLNAYCNVVQVVDAPGANAVNVIASKRGYNFAAPSEYLASRGNTFHHNTVFLEGGTRGSVGYVLVDAENQPDFFDNNIPPDYNTYHLPSLSATNFIYDKNNSKRNARKTFAQFQAAGADVHGSADTNTNSGFPTVAITSPADQSSVANAVTVEAAASDKSGISKVEFYVDWQLQATVNNGPYRFEWNSGSAGPHVVAAMAYSKSRIRACYAITLNKQ